MSTGPRRRPGAGSGGCQASPQAQECQAQQPRRQHCEAVRLEQWRERAAPKLPGPAGDGLPRT
eukprot:10415687-Alexandrium_andersonii.AAC.1